MSSSLHSVDDVAERAPEAADRRLNGATHGLRQRFFLRGPARQRLEPQRERELLGVFPGALDQRARAGVGSGRQHGVEHLPIQLAQAVFDQPEHGGALLELARGCRRLLGDLLGQEREVIAAQLLHPVLVDDHLHALDAERRQHARDVAGERLVEDHHQHAVGAEALGLLVGEVRQAVQTDGGLAAAGAALDHHEARARARDQLELTRVDQRGDLGQVLVLAPLAVAADAELARGARWFSGRGAAP